MRKRGEPVRGLMPSVAAAAGLLPASLHREMHSSVYSEFSLDSGIGDPLAQLVYVYVSFINILDVAIIVLQRHLQFVRVKS